MREHSAADTPAELTRTSEPLVARRARVAMRVAAVLWFLGAVGFLVSLPILRQIWSPLPLALAAVTSLLAVPLAWLTRRVRARARPGFVGLWLRWSVASLFAGAMLLAAPVVYASALTQLSPALAPQATLTNGQRTVVFQGMQHIGSEGFYKAVVYDAEDALSRGYVLYYEGVQPGTPESDAWEKRTLTGGADLADSYRGFAQICGLRFQQDYFGTLDRDAQARPTRHVVADVSTLQMMREYERLLASDPAFAAAMRARQSAGNGTTGGSGAALGRLIGRLKQGTDGQRTIAGTVCRGVMTRGLNPAAEGGPPVALDRVILDFRNRELVKRLQAEPSPGVFLMYGAHHLPGVLALLRADDPRWRVASLKWARTIEAPDHLAGPSLAQAGSP